MPQRRLRRPYRTSWPVALWLLCLAAPAAHAQTGSESSVGYIDSAIPMTQLRLRFDAAYDYPFPGRGGFTYSRSTVDPGQPAEPRADAQELSTYGEFALTPRFSLFAEVPVRAINPTQDPNASHLGDVHAGGKFAFIYGEDFVASFQTWVYAPTANRTNHVGSGFPSIEPGLLAFARLNERLVAESELRLWVPLADGNGYFSDVLRFGVGASYLVWQRECLAIRPVVEFVGWTFLDGRKQVNFPDGTGTEVSARGDTIVNAKVGIRFLTGAGQFYVGYGHALTGETLYKDMLRVEYRYVW